MNSCNRKCDFILMNIKILILMFFFFGFSSSKICYAQNNDDTYALDSLKNHIDINIYDFEGLFTEEEKNTLLKLIISNRKKTGKELLIITTPTIGEFNDIQKYANYVGAIYSNKVKKEDVVTFVISKTLRKIAIATSPKARKILNDNICAEIINKEVIPSIKQNNFFKGIKTGLFSLVGIWSKDNN